MDDISKLTNTDLQEVVRKQAESIFIPENLGAISYYLNSLIPYAEKRILDTEYQTIVYNAKVEGMKELVQAIINDKMK